MPGATGYLGTNYAGKIAAAKEALATEDFVYLHVEAPDETGHEGDLRKKIQAIEEFDRHIVGEILAWAEVPGRAHPRRARPRHAGRPRPTTASRSPTPSAARAFPRAESAVTRSDP